MQIKLQGVAMKFSDFYLQASYLYTYSFLRGVTFEALPLSSYALGPVMLPLLETFLELLLWNSFHSAVITFFFMSSVS
jgi:hypothetical protein